MLAQQATDQFAVADVADDQWGIEHGLAKAGDQAVEHDDLLATFAQLQDDVAADVAGAAGDEDGGLGHTGFRNDRVRSDRLTIIAKLPAVGVTGPTLSVVRPT